MKSRTVIALLAGAAVGAVLGILLAPDKGEESRKKVKKTAEDCVDKVKDTLSNLRKRKDENVEESEEE
jgi:gas vesicle protein